MVLTRDWARQRGASHSPLLAAVVSGRAAQSSQALGAVARRHVCAAGAHVSARSMVQGCFF